MHWGLRNGFGGDKWVWVVVKWVGGWEMGLEVRSGFDQLISRLGVRHAFREWVENALGVEKWVWGDKWVWGVEKCVGGWEMGLEVGSEFAELISRL